MTSTTTEHTLELERDTLTLVIVSPDYFHTGEPNPAMPNGDEESRTYYATTSRALGGTHAVLVDPVERGRLNGWNIDPEASDWAVLGLPYGVAHRGWNVPLRYVSPVARALEVGDRVRVSFPAAPQWDGEGIVESTPEYEGGSHRVRMVTGHRLDAVGGFYLESLTRLEETSPGPVEGPGDEGRTFTQSDIDAAVREARQAQRLEDETRFEAWKASASEVACQYADDNNLCSEFERCMEEIGLAGRSREYVVSLSLSVTARDADAALEEVVERLNGDSWAIRQAVDEVEEV